MEPAVPPNPVALFLRNGEDAPSRAFVKTVDSTITNLQAATHVKKIAFELRRLGVKPGDLVALDLPEVLTLLFIEAVLHEAAASAVPPARFDPDGVIQFDWFITTRPDARVPSGSQRILVDDRFLALIEQNPYGISPRPFSSADDVMWIMFSSGTTGTPKAIPVHLSVTTPATPAPPDPWIARGDFLSFLPAKTPLGLWAFAISTVIGVPFLAIGDNIPAQTVKLIRDNGVRTLVMSPAQVASFVSELEKTEQTLPQIEAVFTLGTAMSPELNARMRAATEGCEILNVYASAEGGVAAVRDYESDDPYDAGIVRASANLQIVDDDGIELPPGEVGHIRYQTSLTASGYLGDADGSAANWEGEWFYPGDLGSLRPDGGLTLAGRASEIINAGGIKIDPALLDRFATGHDGVKDAAAFGYETPDGILRVGIALVTEDGLDVQALVRDFEATYGPAAPQLVARIAEIPRNDMGKPLRLDLAAKYRES